MRERHDMKGCDQEKLFDFALGKLGKKESERISDHLKVCDECASLYESLTEFNQGVDELKGIELDSGAKENIWENLQESVERSTRKTEVKNAWNTILRSGVTYAAAAVIILMVLAVITYNYITPFGYREAERGVQVSTGSVNENIYFPVGAKTNFKMETKASILNADEDNGIIFLAEGTVKSKINKLKKSQKYEVHTADAVFSVKGTAFEVTKNDPDKSEILVTEGTVWVTPKGKNRKLLVLKAGESAVVLGEKAHLRQILTYGEEYLNNSQYLKAEKQFQLYLDSSRDADKSKVEYLMAETCLQLGKIDCATRYYNKISESENNLRAQNAFAALVQVYSGNNEMMVDKLWRRYLNRFPNGNFVEEALFYLAKKECSKVVGKYYHQFMKMSNNSELKDKLRTYCLERDK